VARLADERTYLAKRRAGSDPSPASSNRSSVCSTRARMWSSVRSPPTSRRSRQADAAFLPHHGGEQWWPAEPPEAVAAPLRDPAEAGRRRDNERGEWRLAAATRRRESRGVIDGSKLPHGLGDDVREAESQLPAAMSTPVAASLGERPRETRELCVAQVGVLSISDEQTGGFCVGVDHRHHQTARHP